MNKKVVIVLLIILIVVGLVFGISFYNKTKTDAYKFKKEYEKLNGKKSHSGKTIRTVNISMDNPFVYSNAKEIVKKIDNNETFIVYFGFAECPWCRSMIENLISVAKKKNIDKIYYVDVLNIRDVKEFKKGKIVTTKKGNKDYMKLLEKLDSVLTDYKLDDGKSEYKTGEKRIYAPNIVGVVNGKPEKMKDGISPNEKDPYAKITNKMNNESKKEIECLFKCIKKANQCSSKTTC